MLVSLWIVAALCHTVASNSIDKGKRPGFMTPNIVYKIGDISQSTTVTQENIKDGFAMMEENTCVNFIDSEDAPGRKVDLVVRNAPMTEDFPDAPNWHCMIANVDGQMTFVIGDCISSRSTMQHELGHFLGLCHTQNRDDWRDYIVAIPNARNITSFDDPDCESVPVPEWKYDYGSGMHSTDQDAGSKPVQEGYGGTFPQGVRFPFSDYRTINWLMNCAGNCTTQPKCQNGGYTHPRDCNKCMCNKYYTGDFCETPRNLVQLTCEGKKDHASGVYVEDLDKEKANKTKLFDDFFDRGENRWDIIEAPQGTQIQVAIKTWAYMGTAPPSVSCSLYAVEINDGDLNMVGKMFCDHWSMGEPWHNFTAQSNRLGLHIEYAAQYPTRLIALFTLTGCDGASDVATTSSSTTTTTTDPSTEASPSTMTTATETEEASKEPDASTTTTSTTSEATSTATPSPSNSDTNECAKKETASATNSSPLEITTTTESEE